MTTAEKLQTVAENVNKVYEAGYANGLAEGVEQGKQAQYDEFWDGYQLANNGISLVYSANYMFAHAGWNDETFKPKHSMLRINNANNMFNTSAVSDLKAALDRQGVVFDFSRVASFAGAFSYSKFTVVPEINATSGATLNNMFYNSKSLHTIDKLILNDNGSQEFNNLFYQCESLENITIEGTIGQNGFNVQWSTKLSKASITSIINALSSTTSGLTVTLSKTAVNSAFETSSGAGDGSTSAEWTALIGTKTNWTISLV